MNPTTVRPLTPAERYYAFLDGVSPMSLPMTADLDTCFDPDYVEQRWREFLQVRTRSRLQVHGDLTMSVAGQSAPTFYTAERPTTQWDADLSEILSRPFGLDRAAECRYVCSPAENRARMYLVVHHAVSDGRGSANEMQAFLRSLDGQAVPAQGMPLPTPPGAVFPWQTDRRELVSLLRRIRARQDAAGPLMPQEWARPRWQDAEPRSQSHLLTEEQVTGLRAAARREQGKVFSALAAGWLTSARDVLFPGSEATMQLGTPVDLAGAGSDPHHPAAPSVGVIANRYRIADDPWALARQIHAGVVDATAAGEGELFFHLSRLGAIDDLDEGTDAVEQTLLAAPPSVSVTNLGALDPGSDPAWVRAIYAYLAPAPNQVVFVSGSGYRGRISQAITTRDVQFAAADALQLVQRYGEITDSMTRAHEPSVHG